MITTRLYLDTRSEKGGIYPLKYGICRFGQTAYVPLGIDLLRAQWDMKARTVKYPKELSLLVNQRKVKYDSTLFELTSNGELAELTAQEVRDKLVSIIDPEMRGRNNFFLTMESYIESCKARRTKELYIATADRIKEFDHAWKSLTFERITVEWLGRFETFLARTSPSANARAIHLRNIRAVFNKALDEDKTTFYPFRKFTIKTAPTPKRSLSVDQMRELIYCNDLPEKLERWRDYFLLSFLLIGMNAHDLMRLTELRDGRVEYVRAKTLKPYSVKVEPEARALMDARHGSGSYLLDIFLNYLGRTEYFNGSADRALHQIAERLGLPKGLTMYWARHTWATIAAELDIPKETISAALGHSTNVVTDVYIKFNQKKIDEANRRVIDFVYTGAKPETMEELVRRIASKVGV